jgi:hypothetical protein
VLFGLERNEDVEKMMVMTKFIIATSAATTRIISERRQVLDWIRKNGQEKNKSIKFHFGFI